MAMMPWYVVFCPAGADCGKHNKRLGTYPLEVKAREAVFNHLTASSKHNWDADRSQQAADTAEVTVEEWPAEPAQRPAEPSQQHQHHAYSAGPQSSHALVPHPKRGGPYDAPNARRQVQPDDGQRHQDQDPMTDLSLSDVGLAQYAGLMLAACQKAEQAARASARIARSGAAGFDEEAETFGAAARHFKQVLDRM